MEKRNKDNRNQIENFADFFSKEIKNWQRIEPSKRDWFNKIEEVRKCLVEIENWSLTKFADENEKEIIQKTKNDIIGFLERRKNEIIEEEVIEKKKNYFNEVWKRFEKYPEKFREDEKPKQQSPFLKIYETIKIKEKLSDIEESGKKNLTEIQEVGEGTLNKIQTEGQKAEETLRTIEDGLKIKQFENIRKKLDNDKTEVRKQAKWTIRTIWLLGAILGLFLVFSFLAVRSDRSRISKFIWKNPTREVLVSRGFFSLVFLTVIGYFLKFTIAQRNALKNQETHLNNKIANVILYLSFQKNIDPSDKNINENLEFNQKLQEKILDNIVSVGDGAILGNHGDSLTSEQMNFLLKILETTRKS